MKRYVTAVLILAMLFTFVFPSFAELAPQTVSCTAGFVGGDVDGDGTVGSKDAALLLKHLAGWGISGDVTHADTQRDGVINSKDAAKLLKYLAGWNVGRLCHDDEYMITEESTVDNEGKARTVCRVCGDYVEEKLPMKTYSVCGTDIGEYKVAYAGSGICLSDVALSRIFTSTGDQFCVSDFQVSALSRVKNEEHLIIIGAPEMSGRDGLPDMSDGQPCYGVTEDGTVYFKANSYGLIIEMWLEFLREQLGIVFEVHDYGSCESEMISYNENGADVQPFCRRYTPVDLEAEGYKLVFEDDFDGEDINWDVWMDRAPGPTNGGFQCAASQCTVRDGNMVITNEYREDGPFGPGRYGAEICLKEWQTKGYFETRMKCADNGGGWSAFWFQGHDPYNGEASKGGIGEGGAEIDVMELFGNDGLEYNVHLSGSEHLNGDGIQSYFSQNYYMGDMINEYHTYALEWDEEHYTFYVDGIIVGQTSFADGTSCSTEQLVYSFVLAQGCDQISHTLKTETVVDYLRIYRK